MRIIDTHLHIWNIEKLHYKWLEGNTSLLNRSYEIPEVFPQLEPSGVSGAILVQAENHLEDTDYMLANAKAYSFIQGVVGWLPLEEPDLTQSLSEIYQQDPYWLGIRHLIHDEENPKWLLQDKVIESLEIVANLGTSYDVVGVLTDHIKCVQILGEKIPSLRMVFDHMNNPPIAKGTMGSWGLEMQKAAENPNCYVKISGLGTVAGTLDWSEKDLMPYLEFILHVFGPDRCMLGGDWPVCLLAGSYQSTFAKYKRALQMLLNPLELEKVFRSNAKKFYRIREDS